VDANEQAYEALHGRVTGTRDASLWKSPVARSGTLEDVTMGT